MKQHDSISKYVPIYVSSCDMCVNICKCKYMRFKVYQNVSTCMGLYQCVSVFINLNQSFQSVSSLYQLYQSVQFNYHCVFQTSAEQNIYSLHIVARSTFASCLKICLQHWQTGCMDTSISFMKIYAPMVPSKLNFGAATS